MRAGQRAWELKEHLPNITGTRGAFKTYSTYGHASLALIFHNYANWVSNKPRPSAWIPEAKPRAGESGAQQ
jgi:hypothetical protein